MKKLKKVAKNLDKASKLHKRQSKIIKKHSKNSNRFGKEILISQIVRNLINIMVMDVIKTTSKNIQKQRPKTLNDIYNQKFPLVDFSHKMKKNITLKAILFPDV